MTVARSTGPGAPGGDAGPPPPVAAPPPPAAPSPPGGPAWDRLEEQIAWHDLKASRNQRWYRGLKVTQIATGALIPVLAGVGDLPWLVAGLGAAVVVNEGVNQLFRFHDSWLNYRSTCEALRRERFLFLSAAPPYGGRARPMPLLSERVESILGQANTEWTATQLAQGSRDTAE